MGAGPVLGVGGGAPGAAGRGRARLGEAEVREDGVVLAVMRTLPGLTLRCATPAACRCASPRRTPRR